MQESFLHHVWGLQYFDRANLVTTEGEIVEVFEPGNLNTDAGPDFKNARVQIGPLQWIGTVEVHICASDWLAHHHQDDAAYDTVILHVVWKDNKPIHRTNGTRIPTLELRNRVGEDLVRQYRQLVGSSFDIPCQRAFPGVDVIRKVSMVNKATAVRLERKAYEVLDILQSNHHHWEETTYQLLARAFGFKINSEPFSQLAKAMPLRILLKHHDPVHLEALLFGQAGFLEAPRGDEYYQALRREYRLLAHKYSLDSARLSKAQWLFLRLRPPNFPSLRIAQLAAVIHHRRALFAELLEASTVEELKSYFSVQLPEYWASHFRFSKKSTTHAPAIGEGGIETILVNTVVPLLAAYSIHTDEQRCLDRAIDLLEQLSPENNGITRKWKGLGFVARNSFESQGQIELFNTFCRRKRCLECAVGAAIVRPLHADADPLS